ncbi:aaa-domain-containing protein [Ceraceosorus bombacis]|uniref:Aaa-domain-containing protein n=1 Tax=Ceraceosorus bombacis TaxID=401625 RepID=A0A0P1BBI4_9BASI|nr:aaa-domain-containing protein [Ceraceosorus bombacis]
MNRAITASWGRKGGGINLNAPLPSSIPAASTSAKHDQVAATSNAPGDGALAVVPPGSAAAAAQERLRLQQTDPQDAAAIEGRPPETIRSPPPTSLTYASPEGSGKLEAQAGPSRIRAEGSPTPGSSAPRRRTKRDATSGSSRGDSKRTRSGLPGGTDGDSMAGSSRLAEKYRPPPTRLKDLGGISSAVEKVLELIALPLCHPEIYTHTGVTPPRGVLLHGPPGCGKTMLAGAVAGDLSLPFLSVSAPSIVSGTSGESESTLRSLFEEAARIAPCILFIDEIDAITPKRETAQREMERRIVAQLLTCLDDLNWNKTDGRPVMVIGATNRPDSLDSALRRAGRFDHEIALGVPDEKGREAILRVLSSSLRLNGDFDFAALAKATPGYVGADLVALTAEAGVRAVKRIWGELGTIDAPESLQTAVEGPQQSQVNMDGDQIADVDMDGSSAQHSHSIEVQPAKIATEPPAQIETFVASDRDGVAIPTQSFFESLPPSLQSSSIATFLRTHKGALTTEQLESISITPEDFLGALASVQPSSKREGFATVPDVTWADVGALRETRDELCMAIVEPILRPELFAAVGVSASSGVLLWGPPGCGKTLVAKAVANESRANFISVKGPELLNKYVGESEKAVRQVFSRARNSSPCVIFFDELDALVPRRDSQLSEASARVVNTLLTELDGLESRKQTYVIAATNRPDMIDPAMCRPGRLDKLLYVDLPDPQERAEILRTLTTKSPLAGDIDLTVVALDRRAHGFSGADLAALTREAAVTALRESLSAARRAEREGGNAPPGMLPSVLIHAKHFESALDKVTPSVSQAQRNKYAALRSRLAGSPAGAGPLERAAPPPEAAKAVGEEGAIPSENVAKSVS